ncbi:MAG: hypothetical protein IKS44_05305 [Bacteroidales bacterium]|nr:hypothetical protein [Bacteroidales bacterium]
MNKKQPYVKPEIEEFNYRPEIGFGGSMVDVMHYEESGRLFLGGRPENLATGEEITEYTDARGEFELATWE